MAGVVVGLDYGAVIAVGSARGVDLNLLSEILPAVELAIIIGRDGLNQQEDDDGAE